MILLTRLYLILLADSKENIHSLPISNSMPHRVRQKCKLLEKVMRKEEEVRVLLKLAADLETIWHYVNKN